MTDMMISNSSESAQVGFGGGCHWCTEAVFASLRGVSCVQQGFICSHPPNDQYSEAVLVEFNERHISLDILIEIHLRTHASSSQHTLRTRYRSAIYAADEAMIVRCRVALESLQYQFEKPLVTSTFSLVGFKASEDRYRDYYASNPDKPFCVTYIEPKLAMLKRNYSSSLKPGK